MENIREMSKTESLKINGGNWGVGILLSPAYDIVTDWPANKAAFQKGYSRRSNN
jgi:hypothetical protein